MAAERMIGTLRYKKSRQRDRSLRRVCGIDEVKTLGGGGSENFHIITNICELREPVSIGGNTKKATSLNSVK